MPRRNDRCFVIAEAGVNHDGDAGRAEALIVAAAEAGADAVKFQTFKASNLASAMAPKAPYQLRTTAPEEGQRAMLARLELPLEAYSSLMSLAKDRGLNFLSTPFDSDSLRFLLDRSLRLMKIGSGDLTNSPLLLEVASSGCDLILSTGMADMREVEDALGVLAYGYGSPDEPPGEAAFRRSWADPAARAKVVEKVTLLHCTTDYPTKSADVNLRAMETLHKFGPRVGYSDHTLSISLPAAAVALGACVIEKHLTLDCSGPGPDHAASLEPDRFKAMVRAIRDVEAAQGDGIKQAQPCELPNRDVARKSLVALVSIRRGEVFTPGNLGVKRPGTGLSPMLYWDYLGKTAKRDFQSDELIAP